MINVSIVLYKSPINQVLELVTTLRKSVLVTNIFLVDNSPFSTDIYKSYNVQYLFVGKNIGYGPAHNIAIGESIKQSVSFHLVVNPDVSFDENILEEIIHFMTRNHDVGLLMPKVLCPNGDVQYLCKLIPTPMDLIFRRFFPVSITKNRIDKFEMRSSGYDKIMDVPYLSGCFMFLRTDVLKEVGLFDERFFLYPEDIDLSRRIHKHYRTIFYPNVIIVHHHAQESYFKFRMLIIHVLNLIKYFNKWGWFFDKERRDTNRETIKKLTNTNI